MTTSVELDRAELLAAIRTSAIIPGDMALSRGGRTSWYADLRRITLAGATAPLLGRLMLHLTGGWDFDAVGGLTLGADPVATAMLHQAPRAERVLDAFVVRKTPKLHGRSLVVEGPDIAGRQVLIVEDTSTTGESALQGVNAAQEAGAIVIGVAVVIDRGGGAAIGRKGLPYRSLFSSADVQAR